MTLNTTPNTNGKQIVNKFAKNCVICRTFVPVGEGFAAMVNGGPWQTYCKAHAPLKIEAKAAPISVRVLDKHGVITMPFEQNNLPLLQAMPGAKWHAKDCSCGCNGMKKWTVSLADQDRMRVLEIADRLQLNVAPELRMVALADHAELPDTLYPFQKVGVEWLSRRERGVLGDDMGLGKTVQVLLSLSTEDRVLVVCPASLKYNWADECGKWRSDIKPRVVTPEMKKTSGFPVPKPGEMVIINYDLLPKWLLKDPKEFPAGIERLKGITLVVDEAHFVQNHKSQRSRKINALRDLVSRTWFATGTPLTNNPGNLWSVLMAAGVAREAFGSWTNYLKLMGARKKSRWGGIEWGQPHPSVPERLRRVMLRRTREQVLPDLPKKVYQDITVNGLSTSLRNELDRAWDEQGDYLEVQDCLPDFEEFSKIRRELAEAKIPAMLEMIEQHEEQGIPLVVFSAHTAPVDAAGARPGWAVIKGGVKPEDRQAIVRSFQNGDLKGIALTISAGGVGLTLTHAWKALFVDLDWVPANNAQAEDRICRIGQVAEKCQITRLVADHPLEKHVHNLIAKKVVMIQEAVEATVTPTHYDLPRPGTSVQGETDADYQARMESIQKAAEEADRLAKEKAEQERVAKAKAKVDAILANERARNPRQEQPITPERAEEIIMGIQYMASVCDGAVMRDSQGFNKSDTFRGKTLAVAGLNTEEELRAAEYMLLRYPRQWRFSS